MNNSTLCESDFYKVEDLKFDILKLRKALKQVLSRKEYDDAVGTKYIAGISLNQIPGDPDSIKGENVKGIYWTKPDSSGKEAVRAKQINETKYTEFVKDLEDTYFKEVYDILSKKFKLGRVRILLKEPRSTLSWHRDPEPRLHIPIITNPGCIMVIEEVAKHLPADGSAWVTNNMKYHNFFNGGEEDRIHLVACLTHYKFN
ncbi:MAG: aspartyl/asparaginyl beta-hydroxylase domain-containing protein [Pelagibacteraceae bacterium]|nr:aspartyl/asparaginyl beta-hydroxylase domain-containing protein [Pelagibacteraceae bacterium]